MQAMFGHRRRGTKDAGRRAFSFIELLFVCSMMAIMVALLVPAVSRVREAASRTQCQNNIRNLAMALQNYELHFRALPASSVDPTREDAPGPSPPLGKRSWVPDILPMIEQAALRWDFDIDWDVEPNLTKARTALAIMICPSGGPIRFDSVNKGAAAGDYAAIWRVNPLFYKAAKLTRPDDVRGAMTQNVRTRMTQIRDGLSNTILLGECFGRPQLWIGFNKMAESGAGAGAWAHPDHEIQAYEDEKSDVEGFVGLTGVGRWNKGQLFGFHAGAAQVAMADGSIRSLRNGLSAPVLAALVTRNGNEIPDD